jgi:hypothetical protein
LDLDLDLDLGVLDFRIWLYSLYFHAHFGLGLVAPLKSVFFSYQILKNSHTPHELCLASGISLESLKVCPDDCHDDGMNAPQLFPPPPTLSHASVVSIAMMDRDPQC